MADEAVVRTALTTRDVDRAREMITAAYGPHTPVVRGDPARFLVRITASETAPLGVHHVDLGSIVEHRDATPSDRLLVCRVLDGHLAVDGGRTDVRLRADGLVSFRPDHVHQVRSEDLSLESVRLDLAVLERAAAAVTGAASPMVRFHGGQPRSAQAAAYWNATVRHVDRHLLAHDELMASPLLRAEAFRTLATAALVTFPNTVTDADREPEPVSGTEPATVRRAVEFMDAHAQRDIDLSDVAAAARIGPRGLQAAFRRHRGQTPLVYLRDVRMAGAHRDLQAADPTLGDTVAAVAARWGFAHPGRFSVRYRHTFGCSPSETLAR